MMARNGLAPMESMVPANYAGQKLLQYLGIPSGIKGHIEVTSAAIRTMVKTTSRDIIYIRSFDHGSHESCATLCEPKYIAELKALWKLFRATARQTFHSYSPLALSRLIGGKTEESILYVKAAENKKREQADVSPPMMRLSSPFSVTSKGMHPGPTSFWPQDLVGRRQGRLNEHTPK